MRAKGGKRIKDKHRLSYSRNYNRRHNIRCGGIMKRKHKKKQLIIVKEEYLKPLKPLKPLKVGDSNEINRSKIRSRKSKKKNE